MGAGLLPFCKHNNDIYFLLQTKFEGRKAGFLNDFGGGQDFGETYLQTAIREFVEETEGFFLDNSSNQITYLTEQFNLDKSQYNVIYNTQISSIQK